MSYLGTSYNSNRVQTPLTIDQIAQYAPSAMATRPQLAERMAELKAA